VTVNSNSALGGQGGTGGNAFGGGLYVDSATVTLSSDTVDNNQANGGFGGGNNLVVPEAFGGGLYLAGGTVTLCNVTVQNNSANGDHVSHLGYALGAGLYIASHAKVYIDSFTLAHAVGNTSYDAAFPLGTVDDIYGPYTQQNC
jgi:hypothetical protein